MHNTALREEFEQYYSTFDTCEAPMVENIKKIIAAYPEDSSYMRKTRIIEMFCKEAPVHLFANTPLYFEMSSGRPRCSWGGLQSPAGTYMHFLHADQWLTPYSNALAEDRQEGFLYGWNNPVGIDHLCPGYDNLLKLGLNGIIAQAETALETCKDARKQEFYTCVIRCNRALIHLAERFSAAASHLAAAAETEDLKKHYEKIAAAAAYCPANPPRSFYEALSLIVFYRECVGSVEGIGMSTFGQLDRMLYPYYQADLAAGRITASEAKTLFCDLLIYTAIRFIADTEYNETSTTIILGGCDADGQIIYNELTDMILQSAIDTRALNTKINCRISSRHPDAYLRKIAQVQLTPLPCVMMQNDDTLIPARIKQGQSAEDARLYVSGGCHEVVLANTEVCTRADTWISLPRIFLETIRTRQDYPSFDALYEAFQNNVKAYYEKIVRLKNTGEAHWCDFSPLPLYSSSLTGPLASGKDATEGGAKYNSTALSLLGAATVIDSLYSIKQLVFDTQKLTLGQFVTILDENYEQDAVLRQYILHKIPKHGTNDAPLNAFSAKILDDFSAIAGQTNARGGKYLPAFYPHDIYRNLGAIIGATPDARLAHMPLSRGVSPSEFVDTDTPLDVIHSLKHIDFTKFADSFVTDITLPSLENNEQNMQILVAIIRAFLDAQGSSLQFNLINRDLLVDAQKNPEQHRNLMVRICGYSAVFIALNEEMQNEVIQRAIR